MSALSVAAVQVTSTEDVGANLARCADLTRAAAAGGASLVGLPENFAYLGSDLDHRLSLAEALPGPGVEAGAAPGPILSAMQALARQTETWLLLGGFPERAASAKLVHNTSILLRADGSIAATYRKIHLFDVDVPGGKRFRESESIEPGDDLVAADT
ncbi:MAG TPA: nitrilase-related carbon-nitrogen hydrolase, partial [Polyangia bacterium]|nr:nitrilase-related carbon-nitrogen hydrolase [Polyangia bacterium]